MTELIWVAQTDHRAVGAQWRAFRGRDAAQRWIDGRRHNGLVETYMLMQMALADSPPGVTRVSRPPGDAT